VRRRHTFCAPLLLVLACASADGTDPTDPGGGNPGDDDPNRPDRPDGGSPDATPACEGGDARVSDPATGHCYTLFLTGRSWDNANSACAALGARTHLAVIESAAENSVVFGLVGSGRTWIGATDAAAEGTFVWVNGAPVAGFVKFAAGEPGNGGGGVPGEDCLEMFSTGAGEWNDNECFVAARYVCEREP
jgi:hypothetical protein